MQMCVRINLISEFTRLYPHFILNYVYCHSFAGTTDISTKTPESTTDVLQQIADTTYSVACEDAHM